MFALPCRTSCLFPGGRRRRTSMMDITLKSKEVRGRLNPCKVLLLLLFLAVDLHAAASSTDTEDRKQDHDVEDLKVVIPGPNYVTVGVPASVECEADCGNCTFSLSVDGQAAKGQGNALAFTVKTWVESLTVTCTATDDEMKQTATTTKQLQVLVGPNNISITGPELMTPKASHTYSCHAFCRPSCTYAWMIDKGPWIKGPGNVVSITPQEVDSPRTLFCKAINSVSGLFVSAARNIGVISGPSEIQINSSLLIGIPETFRFVCTAACLPSCRYVLTVDRQAVRGNVVDVTMEHPLQSVTLKCEAQNTVSKEVAVALKTVRPKGSSRPEHSLAIRPVAAKAMTLMLIISAAYSL